MHCSSIPVYGSQYMYVKISVLFHDILLPNLVGLFYYFGTLRRHSNIKYTQHIIHVLTKPTHGMHAFTLYEKLRRDQRQIQLALCMVIFPQCMVFSNCRSSLIKINPRNCMYMFRFVKELKAPPFSAVNLSSCHTLLQTYMYWYI